MTQIEDLLRASLHDHARTTEPVRRAPEADVRRRARRYRRRNRLAPAIGATAALAAGVGVVAVRQSDEPRTSTAAHAPDPAGSLDDSSLPFDAAGTDLPRLALPEWSTVRYHEINYDQQASPVKALLEGEGKKVVVMVLAPPMGYSLSDDARPLDVNGYDAGIDERDDTIWISWTSRQMTVVLSGSGVDEAELTAVARGLTFDGPDLDITTVGHVPEGTTVTMVDQPGGPQRDVEYQFTRGATSLQLHLYAGGRATYEMRIGGDQRSNVEALGRPASLLDYGNGRYRVDVLIGDRTWELDGEPFVSVDEFLAAVDAIQPVDEAAWQRSVADAEVHPIGANGTASGEAATTAPAGN